VSNDPEHKFELAMQTKKFKVSSRVDVLTSLACNFAHPLWLQLARDIVLESESEQKWKQVCLLSNPTEAMELCPIMLWLWFCALL
jgi:hypothetical protein